MENQTSGNTATDYDNFFKISFDVIGLDHLKQISVWAKITSICALIGYIFALIQAFLGHPAIAGSESENSVAIGITVQGSNILGTIIVVIIGGAINYFLYRFAVVVGQGARTMDALKVNSGFDSLRLYFKIISILLIIGLSLVLLAVLFSL